MAQRIWRDYYTNVDAVLYLDREQISESKPELNELLFEESLAGIPSLILGNKIDLPYAVSEDELLSGMGVSHCTTGKAKVNLGSTKINPRCSNCSLVWRMGYGEGIEWLSRFIK